MTIGITGHKGFIGKSLINWFDGCYDLNLFNGDIKNHEECENFIKQFNGNQDVIIHLAGKNKGSDSEILDTNIIGTYNISSLCLKYNKTLSFVSSDYDKLDSYKVSRNTSEDIVCHLGKIGLKFNILKFPKIFGPGCRPFYNSFISTILYNHAKNKEYKHLIKDIGDVLKLMYIDRVCSILDYYLFESAEDNKIIYFNNTCEVFAISIGEIIDIIEGRCPYHVHAKEILNTLEWYKQNDFC